MFFFPQKLLSLHFFRIRIGGETASSQTIGSQCQCSGFSPFLKTSADQHWRTSCQRHYVFTCFYVRMPITRKDIPRKHKDFVSPAIWILGIVLSHGVFPLERDNLFRPYRDFHLLGLLETSPRDVSSGRTLYSLSLNCQKSVDCAR